MNVDVDKLFSDETAPGISIDEMELIDLVSQAEFSGEPVIVANVDGFSDLTIG